MDHQIKAEEAAGIQEQEKAMLDDIAARLTAFGKERENLIPILQMIQNRHAYLAPESIGLVADHLGIGKCEVYGVATFYNQFRFNPPGKHAIKVCLGTACHVRGGDIILESFERKLGIQEGGTTPDREFTFETVNCLGACALGPVVVVDGHYFPHVTPSKVPYIVEKTREGLDKIDVVTDRRIFPLEVRCPRCNHTLMDPGHRLEGYPSVRLTISFGRKHGWIRLSSLYGSYTMESEHEIPLDTVLSCFCPHCHAELGTASNCALCGAPMIPLVVRGGGIVQICSRRGCKSHMLDVR